MPYCANCGKLIERDDALLSRPGCVVCKGESRPQDFSLSAELQRYEKHLLWMVFERNYGNITQTADDLHCNRTTLIYKLRRYGIEWNGTTGPRRAKTRFFDSDGPIQW